MTSELVPAQLAEILKMLPNTASVTEALTFTKQCTEEADPAVVLSQCCTVSSGGVGPWPSWLGTVVSMVVDQEHSDGSRRFLSLSGILIGHALC